jgi:hypothetical protein
MTAQSAVVVSNTPCPVSIELQPERMEPILVNRVADFLHQLQVVMQVVDRVQARAQDFFRTVQVM